jgi:hypothetical protein
MSLTQEEQNKYPPMICGPLFPKIHGDYDESKLVDITIKNKDYKLDKYGNTSGYKNCLFTYDSGHNLEEIGIWDDINHMIIEYEFGYTYLK